MNNKLDLQLLTQTHFDSGALSGLGAVVHRVTQPGDHQMTVLQADKPIQTMPIRVMASPAQPQPGPAELHVDLGHVVGAAGPVAPQPLPPILEIGAQGYMVFHAPPGADGLAVQLRPPGAPPDQPPVFDSRQLQNGDVYAATVLRPGRYSLTNAASGAKGEIRVAYPVVGDAPYVPPAPFEVQIADGGFQPASIQLKPAQGLIFHIGNTKARIQIDLVEPDDGPHREQPPGPRPGFRWEMPARPE